MLVKHRNDRLEHPMTGSKTAATLGLRFVGASMIRVGKGSRLQRARRRRTARLGHSER